MITYFRMKQNEWKVRAFLYGIAAQVMDEHKDILQLIQDIYTALKDVPADELQKELVAKLVWSIHKENASKN